MTSESKENLLKILTNAPEEQPGSEDIQITNIPSSIEKFTALWVFYYKDHTITFTYNETEHGYYINVYKPNNELLYSQLLQLNGTNVVLRDVIIDEEGYIYTIHNTCYLGYWTNPIIPEKNGTYNFKTRITYDINAPIKEALCPTAPTSTITDIKFKKCPFDSRFLIVVTNFAETINSIIEYPVGVIEYTVIVGYENSYKVLNTSTGVKQTSILDIYTGWTDNDCEFKFLTTDMYLSSNVLQTNRIYEYGGKVSTSLSGSLLKTITDCVNYSGKSCVKACYIDINNRYLTYRYMDNDNMTAELYYNNTLIKSTTAFPGSVQGTYSTRYASIGYLLERTNNGEFFSIETKQKEGDTTLLKNNLYFIHLNNSTYTEKQIRTNYNIYIPDFYIKETFNLYHAYFNGIDEFLFILNQNGYNGSGYLNNNSLIGEYGIITENEIPVFARDLYNAEIIGNQITNIIHIPNNYLNEVEETEQSLISKTDNILSVGNKDITKNEYEQMYISWLEQIKVYDNNNGSSYLQKPSLELAKNIFNGFEDNFKITNYRINYSDNTHSDEPIRTITRNGNIATIYLYIYAEKEIDNIQLYDSSYSIPFITIKPNIELEKLYLITQKVKVE